MNAAKLENKAALQKFSRKLRSHLHNKGNQCYATTVLHYLLSNEEFRSQVLLKLESDASLVATYLTKLHLNENVTLEHSLHQLVGMLDASFLNTRVHHDASEFLLKLLSKLDLPKTMFEVDCQAHAHCATPGCQKEIIFDDPRLGKSNTV